MPDPFASPGDFAPGMRVMSGERRGSVRSIGRRYVRVRWGSSHRTVRMLPRHLTVEAGR
jgi:hypothetical protein